MVFFDKQGFSCLFMKIVLENTNSTILLFSVFASCSMNLVFFVLFVF